MRIVRKIKIRHRIFLIGSPALLVVVPGRLMGYPKVSGVMGNMGRGNGIQIGLKVMIIDKDTPFPDFPESAQPGESI